MNALFTNSISNGIHALFLFCYFILSLNYRLKNNQKFSSLIVVLFLSLFILKVLGVFAHSSYGIPYEKQIWLAIGLSIVFLNYTIFHAMSAPPFVRLIVILISLSSVWLNIIFENFLFIAINSLLVYLLAAIYSSGKTRIAFIFIVVSNIIWILLRESINAYLGYELPEQFRYDNDIYHLLLIISSFLLYRSIVKGDWRYPTYTKN